MMRRSSSIDGDDVRTRISVGLNRLMESCPPAQRLANLARDEGYAWGIVGGVPRKWALNSNEAIRDIDIVLVASRDDVASLVWNWTQREGRRAQVHISRTNLGGHRVATQGARLDIWAACATVGIARGWIVKSDALQAVSVAAPLSIDSFVVTSKGEVHEHGFFTSIQTGILNLNRHYWEPDYRIAAKAVKLCRRYRLTPDEPTRRLIATQDGRKVRRDGSTKLLLEQLGRRGDAITVESKAEGNPRRDP